jgi:hypothetical protein
MTKTAKVPKTPKPPKPPKAAKTITMTASNDAFGLVHRLAKQGNLDHRTPEDLKATFRAFIGEAREIVRR